VTSEGWSGDVPRHGQEYWLYAQGIRAESIAMLNTRVLEPNGVKLLDATRVSVETDRVVRERPVCLEDASSLVRDLVRVEDLNILQVF